MAKNSKSPKPTSGIAQRRAVAKSDASEHYLTRRKDIIQAAAEVFRAKGFASASIDDVARGAGVDRATLYYYVGNKKELFREVVIDAVAGNVALAERIAEGEGPPEEKLHALTAGVMASYAQYYPQLYVFIREDADVSSEDSQTGVDIVELSRRFDQALVSIVREGIESGTFRDDINPRLAAYGIVGMLNWTHRWFDPNGPVETSDVANTFAVLAVEGLLNR